MNALAVTGISITVGRGARLVDDCSIDVAPGEIVGLVGESGSGKTSLGLAALGHVRAGLALSAGTVRVGDRSLLDLGEDARHRLRGARISYVAQHPASALNPALRIGTQLGAVLEAHDLPRHDVDGRDRIGDVLESVSFPATAALLRSYPHELSGGQLQRVALAIALVGEPAVVVLDEPTTGLDALTESQVLATIRRRCAEDGLAVLIVTHDLAVVAGVADRTYVMYAGSIVEEGPTAAVLHEPAHPYTRHLLAAVPDPTGRSPMVGLAGRAPEPARRPDGCRFAARCALAHEACTQGLPALADLGAGRRVRCVSAFAVPDSLTSAARGVSAGSRREVALGLHAVSASFRGQEVVSGATLDVGRGEWLAVVGPSGAGKTTLVRAIAGLHQERTGRIELVGEPLATSARNRTQQQRQMIQLVFQHPHGSFNPRRTIGAALARPLRLAGATRGEADRGVHAMLERVSLGAEVLGRYPDQCSGGELQRAAIARALAAGPQVLLCDEITSSLDALAQATIVQLLVDLRRELGLTIVFVTHDLALAAATSDRTAVVAEGHLVEVGPTRRLFDDPQHAATKALVELLPRSDHLAWGGAEPPGSG